MSVVVTGVAGFIGSHLAAQLLEQGENVLGLDCMTTYYDVSLKRANIARLRAHPRFRFEQADLVSADLTPLLTGASRVFHLAAQPGVRGSWGDGFADYVRQNIVASQRVLETVRGTGTRIVVASSSSVYGDAAVFPTVEDAVLQPSSPYGVSKLATEQLAMSYHRSFGLDARAVRYFTVYGPGQRPDMAFSRFISAARRDEAVDVYGDGLQIRDFTYVSDAVDATIRAGAVEGADGGIFNVGGGSQTSVLEVLAIIGEAMGHRVRINHLAEQPGDVRRTGADLTRSRAVLGWEPGVPIDDGLRRQVAATVGVAG